MSDFAVVYGKELTGVCNEDDLDEFVAPGGKLGTVFCDAAWGFAA